MRYDECNRRFFAARCVNYLARRYGVIYFNRDGCLHSRTIAGRGLEFVVRHSFDRLLVQAESSWFFQPEVGWMAVLVDSNADGDRACDLSASSVKSGSS